MEKIHRPTPEQLADVLKLVFMMIETGLMFVPIPVFNNQEQNELIENLMEKVNIWNDYVEKQEGE
ncbi:MAG: DUF1382 family protein [Desulfamplus sp.]|nr:DUF1382 family protein [Desulfamplus sp.]